MGYVSVKVPVKDWKGEVLYTYPTLQFVPDPVVHRPMTDAQAAHVDRWGESDPDDLLCDSCGKRRCRCDQDDDE